MTQPVRSGCPINLSVEVIGDRWSLLILRDMIFGGRRHFRELLTGSEEGIAPNILSSRLKKLVDQGMLTRHDDPTHKQKVDYRLTEAAIELVPVLATLGAWGATWLPATELLSVRAHALADGGPKLWARFAEELRAEHLGTPLTGRGPSVRERLHQAYRDAERTAVGEDAAAAQPASAG